MGTAVRQIETVFHPVEHPDKPAEAGSDVESRLLAELQAQREIINNFRKESRRLTMLLQHKVMQNDDLTRELGNLKSFVKTLPAAPTPLIPCRPAVLDQINRGAMQNLLRAIHSNHPHLEGTAFSALGHLGYLVVRAIGDEDAVAAMQFQMIMSEGNPDQWLCEGSAHDIAVAAIDLWIGRNTPGGDPQP